MREKCRHFSVTTRSRRSPREKSRSLKVDKLRAFATKAASAAAENGSESDSFLAEESVSWDSLGISDSISHALSKIGLHRPSRVQAACIPAILSGTDVVVAAETGSDPEHSVTKGRSKRIKGHFQRNKKKKKSGDTASELPPKEFGSNTPAVRLF
ncbi:hypothetical protein ACS0TY_020636 [Phlomoides rotata]